MYVSVVFGALEDFHRLVVADVAASPRLAAVVGHIAYGYAPVPVVVGAAFVQFLAAVAAGADRGAYMPFVAFEPIGYMFNVYGLVLQGYGLFDRDDVHTDSRSARRHHRRHFFQRQEGHALEEHRQFGMAVHQLGVHIRVFGRTRHEERYPVLAFLAGVFAARYRSVLGVTVAVVVLQHSEIGKLVEQEVEFFVRLCVVFLPVPLHEQRIRSVLTYLQGFG